MNNFCSQCGSRIPDPSDRFCRNCGSRLDQAQFQGAPIVPNILPKEKLESLFLKANPSGQDLATANQMLDTCLEFARANSAWSRIGDSNAAEFSKVLFQKIYDAYPRAWTIWDSEYMASQVLREFRPKNQ